MSCAECMVSPVGRLCLLSREDLAGSQSSCDFALGWEVLCMFLSGPPFSWVIVGSLVVFSCCVLVDLETVWTLDTPVGILSDGRNKCGHYLGQIIEVVFRLGRGREGRGSRGVDVCDGGEWKYGIAPQVDGAARFIL